MKALNMDIISELPNRGNRYFLKNDYLRKLPQGTITQIFSYTFSKREVLIKDKMPLPMQTVSPTWQLPQWRPYADKTGSFNCFTVLSH